MEGLIAGYNRWARKNYFKFPKKITLNDVLLYHLIPDLRNMACTSIVDRDPSKGFLLARNLDWPSFGLLGSYSLVIHRQNKKGSTIDVAVPGFIGTLTGMNRQGLSLAMNVCEGHTENPRGLPAAIYNRAVLESCKTVQNVMQFVSNHSPIGAYHLTAVDPNSAKTIHFYQSPKNTTVIREWNNSPLITFNSRYKDPNSHIREERDDAIDRFFQEHRPLEEALALPYVNNSFTTHRIVMEPATKTFRVAFDNAFAGDCSLEDFHSERLLGS